MKLNLDEEWYKRWMSVDDSLVGVGGLSSFSTCNSSSTDECTYENLTRIMENIKGLMPEPAFERVVMLEKQWDAMKNFVPTTTITPAIEYGFLGIPIDVCPTREEAVKLADELAKDGVRVMLVTDKIEPEIAVFGDSVSPGGE